MENREFYTVNDHVLSRSLIPVNAETIIKVETDIMDDYVWESIIEISKENIVDDYVRDSTIEISKDVDNQNNVELLFESQNVAVNNIDDLNDESTKNENFPCNICGKNFVSHHILKNHLAEHNKQLNLKKNKCKYCEKKFKYKIGLNHHTQKYHKYNELQGIKNIKREEYLNANAKKKNTYSIESIISTDSYNLMVNDCHVLNIKQEKKFNKKKSTFCTFCNENFADIGALTKHMNNHMDRKPYVCRYCFQQFIREGPYNLHEKKHELKNDDQKSVIGFTSNQASKNLTKSLRYKCNYCEKTYSTPSYQLIHMKKFHNESDTTGSFKKPTQCEICLKIYRSPGYLSQHMRIHSGSKPYKCVKCNMDFRFVSNFKRHMKKNVPCDYLKLY